ncbi:MAG: alpha/beta hydrolase [Anaerolineales bacterium]|nr:alpha/beta hydrolase [Anaerolineales bacterium]
MGLYFQEYGKGSKSTIVFLHGGGVSGWMWQPQIEGLPDFHCLVPDLPEQGQSVNEQPFTMQGSAEQIAKLIRTRAVNGKAHLVGLSEGAQVALALLSIDRDCVDHAFISSALVRPLPGGSLITPTLTSLSYRWFVKPLKNSEWWIRLNMKYAVGIPDTYYGPFSQSFKEMTESGFTNIMVENQRFRLPEGLNRVKAPTLIVIGRKEYSAMRQSAIDIAAVIPGSQAYQVHHSRKMSLAEEHNWSLTAPELFTQTVRAWITNQPLPAALKAL